MTTTTAPTIKWPGRSGQAYTYHIYLIGTTLKKAPGNYIFAKKNNAGQWIPIYAGETEDLSQRFNNHHKMACIKAEGATHIHARLSSAVAEARRAEERDIIAKYSPACNG